MLKTFNMSKNPTEDVNSFNSVNIMSQAAKLTVSKIAHRHLITRFLKEQTL